jgi:hypothetical protein
MVMDTYNITEEILDYSLTPLVQFSASDLSRRVGAVNTNAPYGIKETEKKTVNRRKLITVLN